MSGGAIFLGQYFERKTCFRGGDTAFILPVRRCRGRMTLLLIPSSNRFSLDALAASAMCFLCLLKCVSSTFATHGFNHRPGSPTPEPTRSHLKCLSMCNGKSRKYLTNNMDQIQDIVLTCLDGIDGAWNFAHFLP